MWHIDIDRILDAIDKLRAPLDQSNREDRILNKGYAQQCFERCLLTQTASEMSTSKTT